MASYTAEQQLEDARRRLYLFTAEVARQVQNAAEAKATVERLERENKPKVESLESFADGTVIRWDAAFYNGRSTLTYAALKMGGQWWTTQKNGGQLTSLELHYHLSGANVTDVELLAKHRVIKR